MGTPLFKSPSLEATLETMAEMGGYQHWTLDS